MAQASEYIPFRGGLNLTASASELPPGEPIFSKNFEAPIGGGYRSIDGFERVDSVFSPSKAEYWIVNFESGDTEFAVNDKVVFATSLANAIVCSEPVVISGTWAGGTAAGYIVITRLQGVIQASENIQVGGGTYAVVNDVDGDAYWRGALTKALDTQYMKEARESTRLYISSVTTSFALLKQYQIVRGVAMYQDKIFFLADAGIKELQTATLNSSAQDADISTVANKSVMAISYGGNSPITVKIKSTVSANDFVAADISSTDISGGQAILFKCRSNTYFPSGSFQLLIDNTSACASPFLTLNFPELKKDEWVDCVLTYDNTTVGANAVISIGLKYIANISLGTNVQLDIAQLRAAYGVFGFLNADYSTNLIDQTRIPGGKGEFIVHNFGGHSSTKTLYFVDGKNKLTSYDGTTYTEISTGMSDDTPTHLAAHKSRMFLSFSGGSIQSSAAGTPATWSVITGATEIAIGEECTGLKSIKGQALAIFGRNKKHILYGSSTADYNLVLLSEKSGAIEWTIQDVGDLAFLDDTGLTTLGASDTYGDFVSNSFSQKIEPLIEAKKKKATCSCVSRDKSQYRIFFNDGTGIYCTLDGSKVVGLMPVDFGSRVVLGVFNCEDSGGNERTFFYSDDLWIYELDKGNTFDGVPIPHEIRFPFNNSESPITNKRYHRARIDITAQSGTTIEAKAIYSYGNSDINDQPWETLSVVGQESESVNISYLEDPRKYVHQYLNFWSTRTSGTSETLSGSAHNGKETWVIVGSTGTILTSTDNGTTWTARTSGTTDDLNAVHFADDYFVAVGNSGTLLTSSDDGVTWSEVAAAATAASSAALNDLDFFDDLWVVVGATGSIITSSDLASWTLQTTVTTQNFQSVAHNKALKWVAVTDGADSVVATSPDGETWAEANTPVTSETALKVVNDGAGEWLIALGDSIYTNAWPEEVNLWRKLYDYAGGAIADIFHDGNHLLMFTARTTAPKSKLFIVVDGENVIEKDLTLNAADTLQYLKIGHDGGNRWLLCGASGFIMMNDLASTDVQYVTEAQIPLQGNGKNISVSLRTNDIDTKPYTLHGMNLLYSKRGVIR